MSPDSLFAIDWSKVPQRIIEALAAGEARIINGVARDARTFEVLKHMPFRPVGLSDLNNLPEVARERG